MYVHGVCVCSWVCVSIGLCLQTMTSPETEFVSGFPLLHSILDVRGPFNPRRTPTLRIPSKWKVDVTIIFALFLRCPRVCVRLHVCVHIRPLTLRVTFNCQ